VTWTVYSTHLMSLTTDLGLSIRVSILEYVGMVIDTSSQVTDLWNGRGQRLVELTEGCYHKLSKGDIQVVPWPVCGYPHILGIPTINF